MSELDRWRLVLGSFSRDELGEADEGSEEARRAEALDYLYRRAYVGRDVAPGDSNGDDGGDDEDGTEIGPGSLERSAPHAVVWLGEVRELFPESVTEVVTAHALEKFGLTDLMTDPDVLDSLSPSTELLATVLGLRRAMPVGLEGSLRRLIRAVVDDLRKRLEADVRRVLGGTRRRFAHSPIPIAANFDVAGTIAANLKNYDPTRRQLIVDQLKFFDRNTRHIEWDVILCVDQSGSMADSVIHSAVMAGIFAGLGTVRCKLVVFDTAVVDLTPIADDPVEVLMTTQLGGGTDIGGALAYCSTIIANPANTVLVLLTDFCEGGSPRQLVRETRELAEAGVQLLGLASLTLKSGATQPFYNRAMAEQMADAGMQIAALDPKGLADWLVGVMS
ncbi:VWA domain-containing protein [Gordonia sp. X0973]|uniref:VWA domain-containing protein n=1 Tax=Gordonia sp. X0973 TaxID=2742602 RepID=UPI000F52278B|nr:VWA domain-containing protein [Gordonia sp. X0973]QKT08694.1 VWA domain-containing protein [Gordonia sp. X0973]